MIETIPNILLVEDDKDLQAVYCLILKAQGFRVEVANDGMEGLLALQHFKPDLILLDYFMPRMDGKTFLQNFDANTFPNTHIVVTSNVSDQNVLDELLSLGAERTVLKANLSPSELISLITDVLAY